MTDAKNGGGEVSSSRPADRSTTGSPRNQEDAQKDASNYSTTTEGVAPSKTASKASSTRNSTPAASSLDVRHSAQDDNDASSAMEDVQPSRETADHSSKSAHASAKDSDDNDAVPSSYGTRSRNRPGRSRPNYAEDTEMDFEMAPAAMNGNLSDPPSRNSLAPDSSHSSTVSGKKGSASAQANGPWGNSATLPKDSPANLPISNPSPSIAPPPSSNPPQPTTKRRKNAASNATNGNHTNAASAGQSGGKRANQATAVANSARESNMMTFENTGAFLRAGRLEADDGRTVSVNGKF